MSAAIQDTAQNILTAITQPDPLTLIDSPDANTTYIGTAPWGTLTSDPKWTIIKITANCTVTTVGGVVTISAVGSGTATITQRATAPGGTTGNIWDNRAALTYTA